MTLWTVKSVVSGKVVVVAEVKAIDEIDAIMTALVGKMPADHMIGLFQGGQLFAVKA